MQVVVRDIEGFTSAQTEQSPVSRWVPALIGDPANSGDKNLEARREPADCREWARLGSRNPSILIKLIREHRELPADANSLTELLSALNKCSPAEQAQALFLLADQSKLPEIRNEALTAAARALWLAQQNHELIDDPVERYKILARALRSGAKSAYYANEKQDEGAGVPKARGFGQLDGGLIASYLGYTAASAPADQVGIILAYLHLLAEIQSVAARKALCCRMPQMDCDSPFSLEERILLRRELAHVLNVSRVIGDSVLRATAGAALSKLESPSQRTTTPEERFTDQQAILRHLLERMEDESRPHDYSTLARQCRAGFEKLAACRPADAVIDPQIAELVEGTLDRGSFEIASKLQEVNAVELHKTLQAIERAVSQLLRP